MVSYPYHVQFTHSAIRASFSLILFSSMFIVLSLERADDSPSLSLCCNVATSTVSMSFWSLRSSICAFRLPSFASHSYGTTVDEWVQIWLNTVTLGRSCGLRVGYVPLLPSLEQARIKSHREAVPGSVIRNPQQSKDTDTRTELAFSMMSERTGITKQSSVKA